MIRRQRAKAIDHVLRSIHVRRLYVPDPEGAPTSVRPTSAIRSTFYILRSTLKIKRRAAHIQRRTVIALLLLFNFSFLIFPCFPAPQQPKRKTIERRGVPPPVNSSPQQPEPQTGPSVGISRAEVEEIIGGPLLTPTYSVRPGDELEVFVSVEPKLSRAYLVGPDGYISMPYAGEIAAAGQTREQLSRTIQTRLSQFYYDPIVSVVVLKYSPMRAFVMGEVAHPQVIQFTAPTTFLKALSLVGGLPRQENGSTLTPTRAYILRNSRDTLITINLKELIDGANLSMDVPIRDEDIIFVPPNTQPQVFCMGYVNRPSVVPVARQNTTVWQIVAAAGGFRDGAATSKVLLVRRKDPMDKNPTILTIDFKRMMRTGDFSSDIVVQDQDIIIVPSTTMSKFRLFLQNGSLSLLTLGISLTRALTRY